MAKEYSMVESTIQKTKLESITCNKCSKKYLASNDVNSWGCNKFQGFHLTFGYGSKYDMDEMMFDLCEDCLIEFINTFTIPADITEN